MSSETVTGIAALVFDPASPQVAIAKYVGPVGLALYCWFRLRKTNSRIPRWAQPTLAFVAVAALFAALLRPSIAFHSDPDEWEIVFLLDRSESMRRGEGAGQDAMTAWVDDFVEAVPATSRGYFSIITFGGMARELNARESIRRLPRAIYLGESGGIDPGATNIAAALRAVYDDLSLARATTVILSSDGLATAGNALAAAKRLGRRGVPVHVLPSTAEAAGLGFVAANLPAEVRRGSETTLRAVLENPNEDPAAFTLVVEVDGEARELSTQALRAGKRASMRDPLMFDKAGMHYLSLRLTDEQGHHQHRSFYTWVTAPVNVTVIGGKGTWGRALDPETYQVTHVKPDGAWSLDDQDIIIIDGVPAEPAPAGSVESGKPEQGSHFAYARKLSRDRIKRIASRAARHELGVLLVNGDHPYLDTKATVAMSYEDTKLDPLLPTSSKPRPKKVEPPPLEVIVIVDTSGSMDGWKLDMAKRIATQIVHEMREIDTLRLITFQTTAQTLWSGPLVQVPDKTALIERIPLAGGGTTPTQAVERITSGGRCGVFFISDLEFQEKLSSRACATTIFNIGAGGNVGNVRELGEVHLVTPGFNAEQVHLGFFEEKPKDKYFERGKFRPQWSLLADLVAARLPLMGNAIGYPRDETDVLFSRSFPNDPVLTYTSKEKGRVASFLTSLPEAWVEEEEGRRAVDQWMHRLLDWSERDRYWIRAGIEGSRLAISVAAYAPDGAMVALEDEVIQLEFPNGEIHDVRATSGDGYSFEGSLKLRDTSGWGALRITERAPLGEQRIPFFLPSGSETGTGPSTQEFWSSGRDEGLLREIAAVTHGRYEPKPDEVRPWRESPPDSEWPLWMPLVLTSAAALLVLTFLDRNYA